MPRSAGPLHVAIVNRVGSRGPGASGRFAGDLGHALEARGWQVSFVVAPAVGPRGLLRRAAGAVGETVGLARRVKALAPSAVVLMTDPPLLPLAALGLARSVPTVIWSLDLYPDVATVLGAIPTALAFPVRTAMRRAHRRASAVVVLGEAMAERVRAPGVRVETVPLWAPPGLGALPVPRKRRVQLGLSGFVLMYSGTLGRAHPIAGLVNVAERLDGADVTVVVAGGGARLDEFEAEVARLGLSNVQVWPGVPAADLSDRLALADAHVVIQDPATCGMLVPSKVYGALASGRPVAVLGPDAEAAALARAAPRGIALDVGDGEGLARWVRDLQTDPPALPLPVPRELPTVGEASDAFDRILQSVVGLR